MFKTHSLRRAYKDHKYIVANANLFICEEIHQWEDIIVSAAF